MGSEWPALQIALFAPGEYVTQTGHVRPIRNRDSGVTPAPPNKFGGGENATDRWTCERASCPKSSIVHTPPPSLLGGVTILHYGEHPIRPEGA
jgi:hypothetical protein